MIDTEKYTGHTSGSKSELHPSGWWVEWVDPCTWYIRDPEVHLVGSEANRLLIQDAPLLLAEVKRLTDIIADYRRFHTWVSEKHYEVIEEWDFLEGVREGYEVIEEWEGEEE